MDDSKSFIQLFDFYCVKQTLKIFKPKHVVKGHMKSSLFLKIGDIVNKWEESVIKI